MTSNRPKIAIAGQIAEVKRELALRNGVYPGLIANRKMREDQAKLCIDRMQAVLDTLMFCQKHEADIREYIAAKRASAGEAQQ